MFEVEARFMRLGRGVFILMLHESCFLVFLRVLSPIIQRLLINWMVHSQ